MSDPASAPWLTVVTVSLHDDEALAETQASVYSQQVAGVKHVVVLGEQPKLNSALRQWPSRTIVQAPSGVYAAMNEGLRAASGTLVHYLNAGDTYVDDSILGRVKARFDAEAFRWAFGRLQVVSPWDGNLKVRGSDLTTMQAHGMKGRNFPEHPTLFARTDDLRALGGFDTSYRTAADYRLILALVRSAGGCDLGFPVVRYSLGGISDKQWMTSVAECHRARQEVIQPTGLAALREQAFYARDIAEQGARRVARRLRRGCPDQSDLT